MKIIHPEPRLFNELLRPELRMFQKERYAVLLEENAFAIQHASLIRRYFIRRALWRRSEIEAGLKLDPRNL